MLLFGLLTVSRVRGESLVLALPESNRVAASENRVLLETRQLKEFDRGLYVR
jgi:hypothetical protein